MKNSDIKERWENYRKANTDKPLVRDNELKETFNLLNPQGGETILEVGTGNGYLTFPIAKAVKNGQVITADINSDNLQSVVESNVDDLPIKTLLFNDDTLFIDIESGYFNAVATIATLHHFDNLRESTGEKGREKVIAEFYRLLKNGGRLIIADVADSTISQGYFDAINNPENCFPEGHPYGFFTVSRLTELLNKVGFKNIKIEIKKVPWKFKSEDEARDFIHTIHNAKCSIEESFSIAKKYLGFKKIGDNYELGWELFFVIATK